ncbi:hydrolase [Haematobacter missouriensis]|mgnify:CR=1 FL=1|uniref:Alpha/beta hydrolase n=1 Tax=Haematobacter missouriensis TaxID=366616 RepID=A0A212AWW7_9RHOB|nr:alpha/beta fold hydrolase [Haematobacter missouriensis]KFI33962.1 hydrolase [Haematobacter missouriensis]OWJ71266.1 alpha/beta hydrolase [Haematobacter missouriensis]OWJ85958.1 alpha/beta hydrolase [Haematobacter missouriensis]
MLQFARAAFLAAIPLASPALADGLTEKELTAPGPLGALAGTYLTPQSPQAVALILPGSGPTDRNGNGPLGLDTDAYKQLAEALAERGIATLRADKRGMFGSAAAISDANDVTLAAYGRDAIVWAASLAGQTGLPCTWLIGHSEGGLVALSAVAGDERAFCGVILLATPGRSLAVVLEDQLTRSLEDDSTRSAADAALDSLQRGQRVPEDQIPESLRPMLGPQIQGYLIDLFSHDPGEMTRRYGGPLMIVSGGEDLQLDPTDAATLTQARNDAVTLLLPGMNHVLKEVPPGDKAANLASYSNPSVPLATGLADAVARFITRTEDEPFGLAPPTAE